MDSIQCGWPWSSSHHHHRRHTKIKYIILLLYPKCDSSASLLRHTNKKGKSKQEIMRNFTGKAYCFAKPPPCWAIIFRPDRHPVRQGYHLLHEARVRYSPEKCPNPSWEKPALNTGGTSDFVLCHVTPPLWSRLGQTRDGGLIQWQQARVQRPGSNWLKGSGLPWGMWTWDIERERERETELVSRWQ